MKSIKSEAKEGVLDAGVVGRLSKCQLEQLAAPQKSVNNSHLERDLYQKCLACVEGEIVGAKFFFYHIVVRCFV